MVVSAMGAIGIMTVIGNQETASMMRLADVSVTYMQ
jgi:hypothetical protein